MPHPLQVAAETKVCFSFPRGGILAQCLEVGPGDGGGGYSLCFSIRGRGNQLSELGGSAVGA